MSAAKQKGTRFEGAVVDFLVSRGWVHAERRALNGTRDKGDIAGLPGVVIEVKNQSRHTLAEWVDEATTEGVNAGAEISMVWMHRRGKSSAADGYVVMTGDTAARLLKLAGW